MTIQEIKELTVDQVESILLGRLESEEPTQEELEAELEVYKAELIEVEEARLAELARLQDLKDRFDALPDKGLIQAQGISNPAAYFRDEVLNNEDEAQAEANLSSMENAYASAMSEFEADSWIRKREHEYSKLDKMLLEAVAEKEAGRPEKMDEYLVLREKIRLDNPKPL